MATNGQNLGQLSAQIEDLVRRVEAIADPIVRLNVQTLLQSLLELHGQAFKRATELIAREGQAGRKILEDLTADKLISGLLLLYECHPDSLNVRVGSAIQKLQERSRPSGGSVALRGITDGIVHVRVTPGAGCASSAIANEMIEDFIFAEAPEVSSVEIERVRGTVNNSGELVQLQANSVAGQP